MAVVFVEGFDLYNGAGANTGAASRWVVETGSGGSSTASMVSGRFGGQAIRLSPSTTAYKSALAQLPAAYTSLTVAGAVRLADIAPGTTILTLTLANACQINLSVDPAGVLYANSGELSNRAGVTALGNSGVKVIYNNTWHFVEYSALIHGSAGTVVVKVDGATVISLTGKNTKPLAGSGVDGVRVIATGGGTPVDWDDVYVVNSTTSLGECRVETLRASADTATKDWTASVGTNNAAMVDDTTADGDSTYVQSSVVGDHDLYDLDNLSTTPTAIYAVQPVVFAKKTDSATRTLSVTVQSGGTNDDGSAPISLSADYNAFRPTIYATDPHDSASWTKAKVDAVKAGPKVAS